jgi:hypothetical protein
MFRSFGIVAKAADGGRQALLDEAARQRKEGGYEQRYNQNYIH